MEEERTLYLFRVYQSKNTDYDSYDSFVVAAYNKQEAMDVHPSGNGESVAALTKQYENEDENYSCQLSSWAPIQHIKAEFLGVAHSQYKPGELICSSYNAG